MAEPKPTKVFDVAKPGKTPPGTSAKPILVTNRPVLRDPMVKTDTDDAEVAAVSDEHRISVTTKLKIKPLHDKAEPASTSEAETAVEPTTAATEPAKPAKAKAATTSKETSDTPVGSKLVTDFSALTEAQPSVDKTGPKPADTSHDNDETQEDTVQNRDDLKELKTETSENTAEIEAQKEQERAAELEKLALSKQYFLPINQIEHRRNKRALIVGLILVVLLGAAWADVTLDAGLVTIPGVKAPTHFFSK